MALRVDEQPSVALLHPGDMGASVGACLTGRGIEVGWYGLERSPSSHERAKLAALKCHTSLETLIADSDVILSICPPANAADVAQLVCPHLSDKLYVDGNAISPRKAERIAALVENAGAHYVDGGIIGPPVKEGSSTRLYLSGTYAATVARMFDHSLLEVHILEQSAFAASTLKMCFAAWSKGSSALLLNVAALAAENGQLETLLEQWRNSSPALLERLPRDASRNAPKAWRFVDEMLEISQTFADAGLNQEFHSAAADVYQRLAKFKGVTSDDVLEEVLYALVEHERG